MQMLGFSLNMLSLLGMVLAIGLVVDDAIVVVENVERQLEAGLAAARRGRARRMAEVTGPIIATTAVLMAVFMPVAFIPGVAGRLYNQFALTVAISVGISAFNSLTLSPALGAAFLRHRAPPRFVAVPLVQRRLRLAVARLCAAACGTLIRSRWAMLGAVRRRCLAPPISSAQRIPSTFLPVEDQGYFFVVVQLARRRLAGAHRRGRQEGPRHPAEHAGRRDRRLDQRPQLPDQRRAIELGRRIRDPEAMGRARRRSRAPRTSSRRVAAEAAADSGSRSRSASIRRRSRASARPAASNSRSRI